MKRYFFLLAAVLFLLTSPALSQQKATVRKSQPVTVKASEKDPPAMDQPIATEPGKDVVAIYHFTTARDYSYDYALGVGNAVEAGFVRSTRFTVVERNRFGAIKEEDKFKEANTSEIVAKASRFGAKIIVTGHVVGVSHGDLTDYKGVSNGKEYADISLSFKIIDVESGQIKMSEIIRARGTGTTSAEAYQNSYIGINNLVRAHIGVYLPQRFKFMSVVSKAQKKDYEYLQTFKIWGGSDNGLKVGDVVELYSISFVVNPVTNKKVEEKKLLAENTIIEINSGSTATCAVLDAKRYKSELLSLISTQPDTIVVEFKGNTYVKPKGLFGSL